MPRPSQQLSAEEHRKLERQRSQKRRKTLLQKQRVATIEEATHTPYVRVIERITQTQPLDDPAIINSPSPLVPNQREKARAVRPIAPAIARSLPTLSHKGNEDDELDRERALGAARSRRYYERQRQIRQQQRQKQPEEQQPDEQLPDELQPDEQSSYDILTTAPLDSSNISDALDEPFIPASLRGSENIFASHSPRPSLTPLTSAIQQPPIPQTAAQRTSNALQLQKTPAGPSFINQQARVYQQVFKDCFHTQCSCQPSSTASHQSDNSDGANSSGENSTASLRELAAQFKTELPDLYTILQPHVFSNTDNTTANTTYPQSYFSRCKKLLTPPSRPQRLSIYKDEQTILQHAHDSVKISRLWDVDSVWLGATALEAIRPTYKFTISFLPPFSRSITGNQAIQPHGVNLGSTRNIFLGSATGVDFSLSVFVFFPETNSPSAPMFKHGQTRKAITALSLDRQRDLRQELPQSFDIANAKSKSYQEKPASQRWRGEDESRALHLRYTLPGSCLAAFWREFTSRCNEIRIPRHGQAGNNSTPATFAYFRNPQLLFQAHDLKNQFAHPMAQGAIQSFIETIFTLVNPEFLDLRSCWLDIGFRDMPAGRNADRTEIPLTLLWKQQYNKQYHSHITAVSPSISLKPIYYRLHHIRDAEGYSAEAQPPQKGQRASSRYPGHPGSHTLGIVHGKSYSCSKELFSTMYSGYRTFSTSSIASLALTETMANTLYADAQQKSRAPNHSAPSSKNLEAAWDANKRHLLAVASHQHPTSYAARKEITFRFNVILTMFSRGSFDPVAYPYMGAVESAHYPFWIIPTVDLISFITMQACRFILPVDQLFYQARLLNQSKAAGDSTLRAATYAQVMAGFYTAQLMLRLLALSLHDSAHEGLSYDKWIWLSSWKTQKIENGQRVVYTRKGLGLSQAIERMGTLWFEARHFYWPGGHIAIAELMRLYIPRSPLQARWSHQASIQAGSARSISPAYFITLWMDEAKEASLAGDVSLVTRLYERAITLTAEEVGRSYSQHLLAKLQFFWTRLRRAVEDLPLKLPRLEKISRDVMQPRGKILTAEVLLEVYQEAWNYYYPASSTTSLAESSPSLQPLPEAIPCWIGTKDVNPQKWSDFVFAKLFVTGSKSTWHNAPFLALYRELRQVFLASYSSEGAQERWDNSFQFRIGRYIMVMFNGDKSKEANTSNRMRAYPTLFSLQYWAPYMFSSQRRFTKPLHQCELYLGESAYKDTPIYAGPRQLSQIDRFLQALWITNVIGNSLQSRYVFKYDDSNKAICYRAIQKLYFLIGKVWEVESAVVVDDNALLYNKRFINPFDFTYDHQANSRATTNFSYYYIFNTSN
ncbi:hypothetical protein M431DRAFT_488536 [Trichoderma harzianum CBS 226.95]|uniref:Uncharacterized protein n=1 Tax=Trichoderma harzianum CBS 226.95 TaxID=983964 RepID=A0A2T3ZRT5_TRIHA|nr:hypothetical protein M431DRAFT_488536 [Trichoderma harzianum CBS 226.95]PTB47505.1 hypothetical protein M431DRAFT_488536 [Trichoderma harzianum CBS 226.95]